MPELERVRVRPTSGVSVYHGQCVAMWTLRRGSDPSVPLSLDAPERWSVGSNVCFARRSRLGRVPEPGAVHAWLARSTFPFRPSLDQPGWATIQSISAGSIALT